jgi:(1->4)-alpha-D-glucan 1-alpha-D-glucosylmutase
MKLPTATYRLQLRGGVDFAAAAEFLPHLKSLGISHLYLSPIFTATPGSTHGYDVTDAGEIDPVLGGRAGFEALSAAAQTAGVGLILDLVPNHMAFSLSNPWLSDVLRHGQDSRYAGHFDIDWGEGPLVLPWLDQPFEALLAQGKVSRVDDTLIIGELALPLRPGSTTDNLAALHDQQVWRAVHWARERDSITHRRFFNVTGLIGMRVEDAAVFTGMHALVAELVGQGHVQGLRIDHIDGLADPAAYLDRLRAVMGDIPIWVEKILTGDETLPDWPVQGTTGYEAATIIARVLSDAGGAVRLQEAWVQQTGGAASFHQALQQAKAEVIRRDLAAELRHLITLARRASTEQVRVDPGDEALREAIIAMLIAFPRYRTYFTAQTALSGDLTLMADVADTAVRSLRSREVIDLIVRMITAPENAAELALQTRFQQVTGALLAKSHEDTAGFRWTPFLVACEVGADPDTPSADMTDLQAWAQAQPGTGLLLSSSHDAKRSMDARMRLAAWTHLSDDAFALLDGAKALPQAKGVPENALWYLAQSALALWDIDDPDLTDRLTEHTTKALREADEITSWTNPDIAAEAAAHRFVAALVADWGNTRPAPLARLVAKGAFLSLAHLAIKLMLPGIPDIYRGSEDAFFALTDPDNRHPVNLDALCNAQDAMPLSMRKRQLLAAMMDLRRANPDVFTGQTFSAKADGPRLEIRREGPDTCIVLSLSLDGENVGPGTVWPPEGAALNTPLALSVVPKIPPSETV